MICAAAALLASGARADVPVLDVPARRGEIVLDGDLADWTGPTLAIELRDPAAVQPVADTAVVRLAWDAERLWVAFDVRDAEVFLPPPGVDPTAVFQYDSVEVYVDALGDDGERMRPDDFQFVISAGGSTAVFAGDALPASVPAMRVPKSLRPSTIVEARARTGPRGYVVECAVPFRDLGLASPRAGLTMGIDLALNDWTADHPPFVAPPLDFAELERMDRGLLGDADASKSAAFEALARQAYHPWSWAGTRDFGYPHQWHRVRLVGRPPPPVARPGAGGWIIGATIAGALLLGSAALLLLVRRRYRQRMAALLARLEELEQRPPEAGPATPAADEAPPHRPPPDRDAAPAPAAAVASDQPAAPAAPEQPAACATAERPAVPGTPQRPVAPAVPEQAAAPAVPGSAAEPAVPAEAPAGGPGLAGRIDAVLRLPRGEEPAPMALAKRAVIHVRAHLEEGHTVAGLADVLHVSPRTLERGLKDALGCTPRELILALRMGEARRLLETGALRVNEVGYRVGFDSPEHFSRRFREFHGIAPSAVARKPRPAGR